MSHDDLAVALALADQADAVTLDRFGAVDLRVDTKPDLTPVSDADHAVETGLRATLARARPDDAVLGDMDKFDVTAVVPKHGPDFIQNLFNFFPHSPPGDRPQVDAASFP